MLYNISIGYAYWFGGCSCNVVICHLGGVPQYIFVATMNPRDVLESKQVFGKLLGIFIHHVA